MKHHSQINVDSYKQPNATFFPPSSAGPSRPNLPPSTYLPILPWTIQRPKNQSKNLPTPKVYNQRTISIIYYPRKLKFEHPISKMGTQSELKSKIRFKLKFKIKLKTKLRLELQTNNQDLQHTSLKKFKAKDEQLLKYFCFLCNLTSITNHRVQR